MDYRQVAHQILAEDRFRSPPLPRPLHGALDALGGVLAPVGKAVDDVFSWAAGILPGGTSTVWVLLAGAIVALAAVASGRMTDRALVDRAYPRGRLGEDPGAPDARALEAMADAAEGDGQFGRAVRLRFQAGLLQLGELGVLSYRPSLPNATISRRLCSPAFDALARRFEEVAYGGREAEPADAGHARDAWHEVLAECSRA